MLTIKHFISEEILKNILIKLQAQKTSIIATKLSKDLIQTIRPNHSLNWI
jgi:hypothetical protein